MTDKAETPDLTRRKLLGRVGLAAGAAYVAPVMMHLNAAHASGGSRGSGGGRAGGGGRSGSGPSRGSRASRGSRGSRPQWRSHNGNAPVRRSGGNNEFERFLNRVFGGS
jgi:hypothetical protein